jgi:ABC-2 type transport system permease protein
MTTSAGVDDVLAQVRLVVVRNMRNPRFLIFAVGIPLAIYVGYLVTGVGGSIDQPIGGITPASYLMVSMAAFGAMIAAAGVAAGSWEQAPVRTLDGAAPPGGIPAAGPNPIVRGASAMVLVLPALIVVGLAAGLDGIRMPVLEWLRLATSVWLGAIPFVAFGLLVGPLLDADTGDVVLLSVLVVVAILGGLFQPIETLPAVLGGLAQVVPSFHLADLGWTALADRTADPADVLVLAGYTVGFGAVAIGRKRIEDARVGE